MPQSATTSRRWRKPNQAARSRSRTTSPPSKRPACARLLLREFEIVFQPFGLAVICLVGDYAAAMEYTNWLHDETVRQWRPTPYRGLVIAKQGYCPVLWLPSVPRTTQQYGTLAHEIYHAVGEVLDYGGVEQPADEELVGHMLGYGVEQFLEHCR